MLVYPPLCHVSYFTISPSDLSKHHPPPLPLPPPLRSTLSSLSNQIHFSPSPSTIFHFINLSYLELNVSSAQFLLIFSSQPAPLTLFPSPDDHPPPAWFFTPPPDPPCPPLWIQRAAGGILLLRGASVSWRFLELRAALLAPGFRFVALFRSRIMQSLIPFHWHLRLAGHEIRRAFKIKVCAAVTDTRKNGWGQKQQAVWRCCHWKGKMETWWWGGKEKRQVEREGGGGFQWHKLTFLLFLGNQGALNKLFHAYFGF